MTEPYLINVRGTNGSGKTTLLRKLASATTLTREIYQPKHIPPKPLKADATEADRAKYEKALAKVGKPKGKPIVATICPGGVVLIGDYTRNATGTTAGLDRISTQEDCKNAIRAAKKLTGVRAIIFEGIVVSTIFGPWLEFSQTDGPMIWAYLTTPLDVCLARIKERNGGKEIDETLVEDKTRSIAATQEKAIQAGEQVWGVDYYNDFFHFKSMLYEILEN